MKNGYQLSRRLARRCRWAALLFLVVAIGALSSIAITAIAPGGEIAYFCGDAGCDDRTRLIEAAPEDQRAAIHASPAAQGKFADHLTLLSTRAGLAGTVALVNLPFAMLMMSVALALRQVSRPGGGAVARALPWLRRGALAALLMAAAGPVAESLRESLLSLGTPEGPHWTASIDLGELAANLLLAFAVYAVTWALDLGSRAERDLNEFV